MEKSIQFSGVETQILKGETEEIYSEVPRAMVSPRILALELPGISPSCFLL